MALATQAGPHLHHLSRYGLSSVYLVEEDDGLTLVDTSVFGQARAILAAVGSLGKPLRRIVLTHAHGDHAGSLDALSAAVDGVEVLVGAREAPILAGDLSPRAGEAEGRMTGFLYQKAKTTPTRLLEPGERVGSLEVVGAPGHTPGQIALLDGRDATLICGDAYLALGGLFVTTTLVRRFPLPALLGTWHKPTALETARRLRALEPARLATGHGRVVEPALAAMDRALEEAQRQGSAA